MATAGSRATTVDTHDAESIDAAAASLIFADGVASLTHAPVRRWRLQTRTSGEYTLQRLDEGGAHFYVGEARADRVSLVISLTEDAANIVHGSGLDPGLLMLVSPRDPIIAHVAGPNSWASLTMPAGVFERTLALASPMAVPLGHGPHICEIGLGRWRRACGLVRVILECPHARTVHDAVEDLVELLVIGGLCSTDEPEFIPDCRRSQLLDRVIEFISPQSPPRISVLEMARHAGVSERTLRNLVRSHFGVAPKRLLVLRRLQAARAALETAPPEESITQIVSRVGITEFGRFASRYRVLFGETPSLTRARHR